MLTIGTRTTRSTPTLHKRNNTQGWSCEGYYNTSVNSSCAHPPGFCGAFPLPCQSRSWGISKFCTARESGISQPRGQPRAFDMNVVSYPKITASFPFFRRRPVAPACIHRRGSKNEHLQINHGYNKDFCMLINVQ